MSDTLRFIGRLITQPKTVGAIAPSSKALARAMAAQIDAAGDGPVLELGPGTGVATAALLARGFAPERITAIEYDPDFAALLAQRFAGVKVINGDAFDLDKTLAGRANAPFVGAISGVPLLNHSVQQRTTFLKGVLKRLKPGAPYVQFSYGLHCPVAPPAGVTVSQAAYIFFNLPPARVWVYRQR
ncbi:MAG TPA: methyltransferase domain-containing protein [Rhizomicrobium sp.]|jgi:phosphatidylethanolamine/phosphatidyl-N-methylethanolamine N-methyltransferase|nr:methyltransferase domain-containing protein [Rhizomicrobium sp.]